MAISTQLYVSRVLEHADQTACIRTLYLSIPNDYPDFRPGHIVQVGLSSEQQPVPSAMRAYCVCSSSQEGYLELCIDLVGQQGFSGTLYQAGPGQKLVISKPYGEFGLQTPVARPLMFIGFASGVGVLRGILRDALRVSPALDLVQFYAVNHDETAIPYARALAQESRRYPSVEIYPVLQTQGYDMDDLTDRIFIHADMTLAWDIYIAGVSDPVLMTRENLMELGMERSKFYVQTYSSNRY